MTPAMDIKARERDAIIQSLRAGVVPRSGLQHIQVGRRGEITAIAEDMERIKGGGSALRFVIGEYGSGKTFLLHLSRSMALQMKLVTAHADLSPDRRLHATDGRARSLYTELMRNISTRAKPDGAAMPSVVERFVSSALSQAQRDNQSPATIIDDRLQRLSELVGGYDFAQVVAAYWQAHDSGDELLKRDAIRWLRGEFTAKADARNALGVRSIVDDTSIYDHMKLMALFVRLAGYEGLVVCIDEMVNLYKLTSTVARRGNYEQLLRIVNDSMQGTAVGIGFMMGGTPEFLTDTRRGLYSYEALQSRLAENAFATDGLVDFSGPIIRLSNLTQEDLYVLLTRLRDVWESTHEAKPLISDQGIQTFMNHCFDRVGEAYFRTPRTTIREFMNLMAVLEQNPTASVKQLIGEVTIEEEDNPDLMPVDEGEQRDTIGGDDDELASFRM